MSETLPAEREDTQLGPAMTALRPQWRAFVIAYCTNGCHATAAAREVGYSDTGESAKAQAYKLIHDKRILAAIREWTIASVQSKLPVYKNLLDQVAFNDQHKDQTKGLLALLDRGGMPAVTERNVNVNVVISREEKIAKIRELAEKHGIPVANVLGNVTDVEFYEEKDGRLEGF